MKMGVVLPQAKQHLGLSELEEARQNTSLTGVRESMAPLIL